MDELQMNFKPVNDACQAVLVAQGKVSRCARHDELEQQAVGEGVALQQGVCYDVRALRFLFVDAVVDPPTVDGVFALSDPRVALVKVEIPKHLCSNLLVSSRVGTLSFKGVNFDEHTACRVVVVASNFIIAQVLLAKSRGAHLPTVVQREGEIYFGHAVILSIREPEGHLLVQRTLFFCATRDLRI